MLQTIMMRILIVEDEEHLARLLAEVLEREGHALKTVSDGRSGLTRALSEDFELLVVDRVRLGDSEFVLADPENEARGQDVYDAAGQRIGGVEDLYIDPQERAVRILEVGAGSFLRIGEKCLLVPVESVTHLAEDPVTIEPLTMHPMMWKACSGC